MEDRQSGRCPPFSIRRLSIGTVQRASACEPVQELHCCDSRRSIPSFVIPAKAGIDCSASDMAASEQWARGLPGDEKNDCAQFLHRLLRLSVLTRPGLLKSREDVPACRANRHLHASGTRPGEVQRNSALAKASASIAELNGFCTTGRAAHSRGIPSAP